MKRAWIVALIVLLAAAVRPLTAAPFDNRVPADALVYVAWQGADNLTPQYAQSNLKGFVENSKLPEFFTQNWPKWMAADAHGDPVAAENSADAQALASFLWHHPAALYVGPMGFADPNKPNLRVALLCDAGADVAAMEQLGKKIIAKIPNASEDHLAVTRDGTVLMFTANEATPAMFSVGAPPSRIAGAPGYLAATKSLRPNAALTAYVNADKLLAAITEGINKSPMPAEARAKTLGTLQALGLSALTNAAYSGTFDGKEWAEDIFVGTKGTRTGILTLLDAPPISDDTLKMIPKDAAAFTATRLDLTKALAQVRSIIKQVAPENSQQFEQGLAMGSAVSGIDLEKDLINALGDEWIIYRGPRTEEMTSHPPVFVQKVRDPAAIERTLATLSDKITQMGQGKVTVEKLDTGTISVSGVRLPFVTIAWTLRSGVFYISSLEGISGAVEQVEKKGPSILDNPNYVAVRKALPPVKASAISYHEPAKLYPELYQMIMSYLPMARMAGADIPGDIIPVPRRISPFLSNGGGIAWSDADGYHASSRAAFPGAPILSGQMNAAAPAMMVAILLPSLAKSRELASRSSDAANLRGIMNSAVIYAAQNNDQLPENVARLVVEGMSPKLLVSKRAGTPPLVMTPELEKLAKDDFAAFSKKIDEHCDFVYIGKDVGNTSDASVLTAFEKPNPKASDGINMAFGDVHVDFVRYKDVRKVLEDANTYRKGRNLPLLDIDALMKDAPIRTTSSVPMSPPPAK